VLPLFLSSIYVDSAGGRLISINLFTQTTPAPGLDGGGGSQRPHRHGSWFTVVVAPLIAFQLGLVVAHFFLGRNISKAGLSPSSSAGNDILAGGPSIHLRVFVYGAIVATRVFFGQSYTACRRGHGLGDPDFAHRIKTTDGGSQAGAQSAQHGEDRVGRLPSS